jgi:hypothetical protein
MKFCASGRGIAAAAAFSVAAFVTPAFAQTSPPSILLVHGIAGPDLGAGFLPTLPVDVAIRQGSTTTCVRPALQFTDIAGPYPVTASASVAVIVSNANPLKPCSNSALLKKSFTLKPGDQVAVVAAETAGGPALLEQQLTESVPIAAGTARLVAFHDANAPAVDLTVTYNGTDGTQQKFVLSDLQPGGRTQAPTVPFTHYAVTVSPTGSSTVVAGPVGFDAAPRGAGLAFVVGDAANGTVTVLYHNINNVFNQ